MSKPVPLPPEGARLEVAIQSIAGNGKGQGRALDPGWERLAFFVPGAAPGDRLRVAVTGGRKRYVEAEIVEVLAPGPDRVEPPCPHFAACGGCQLMHLAYPAQLAAKLESLAYLFRRRGLNEAAPDLVVASPDPLRYRVRCEVAVGPDGRPGLRAARSHDVVPIESCQQMRLELESAVLAAARHFAACGVLASGGRVKGVWDESAGRVFVHPHADARDRDADRDWFAWDNDAAVEIDAPRGAFRVGEFNLRYAPDCFTQVNPGVNGVLVAHALAELAATPADRVLELYAGIGNFTLPIAATAAEVTAVEWPRAAAFGRANAAEAGLANATFVDGDVPTILADLVGRRARFDLALLDPPRGGLGSDHAVLLAALGVRRVVYVSCEPLTLAEDLRALVDAGFRATCSRAFDMFPQTFHVETCLTLQR